MAEGRTMDFCTECRRETGYALQKRIIEKTIRDKEYRFEITVAVCSECGAGMNIPGLIDKNIREIDEQYRIAEGLMAIGDIEKLMKLYKIGKAPLSLALGFGEVTISRYLSGQVPSREYSDIMKRVMRSPACMKMMLMENREKIAETAYNKAMSAAEDLENMFSVSSKMLQIISYVFETLEEVTPLTLQKILYFIQGIYSGLHGEPVFMEDCEAWVHGPVYPEVYNLFRDFKYNPIEDARFAVLGDREKELTGDEKRAAELVVRTFGIYSGKMLERITHREEPWIRARRGYGETIPSREKVSKESIRVYYDRINRKFGIDSEEGLRNYILHMLHPDGECSGL